MIALGPKDEPIGRHFLATTYFNLDRFEEAESLLREAYPSYSDCIGFVEAFERTLIKLGNFEEADKMTNRIHELEAIYRRR